jgi:hypothetical protein
LKLGVTAHLSSEKQNQLLIEETYSLIASLNNIEETARNDNRTDVLQDRTMDSTNGFRIYRLLKALKSFNEHGSIQQEAYQHQQHQQQQRSGAIRQRERGDYPESQPKRRKSSSPVKGSRNRSSGTSEPPPMTGRNRSSVSSSQQSMSFNNSYNHGFQELKIQPNRSPIKVMGLVERNKPAPFILRNYENEEKKPSRQQNQQYQQQSFSSQPKRKAFSVLAGDLSPNNKQFHSMMNFHENSFPASNNTEIKRQESPRHHQQPAQQEPQQSQKQLQAKRLSVESKPREIDLSIFKRAGGGHHSSGNSGNNGPLVHSGKKDRSWR